MWVARLLASGIRSREMRATTKQSGELFDSTLLAVRHASNLLMHYRCMYATFYQFVWTAVKKNQPTIVKRVCQLEISNAACLGQGINLRTLSSFLYVVYVIS